MTAQATHKWGSPVGHFWWAVLTLWWTLGIGNLLYALLAHGSYLKHQTRQEAARERAEKLFAEGGAKAVLDDAIRRYAVHGWKMECQTENMTQLIRRVSHGRRHAEEGLLLEVDDLGALTATGALSKKTKKVYERDGYPHERIG